MTEPLPCHPVTADVPGPRTPETSLRSGTELSTLAALLLLVGWLAILGTFLLGPSRVLSPEQDIEPGEGFGLAFLLVLPFYALSLLVVPAALVALLGWLPRLLTGTFAPVLVFFGLWTNHETNASLHRVLPTLETMATLATWAGAAALVIATLEAIYLATPAGRRSRTGSQPTQSPRPPQPPYAP